MTRLLTYNILVGGGRRIDAITNMIRAAHPDVVGLVEATNPRVVEELAERLGMECRMTGQGKSIDDWQIALLTRLPIVSTTIHTRPGRLTKPLLEVRVREEDGHELAIFVTHLAAAFSHGRGGNSIRQVEVREILRILAELRAEGIPHVLMGDFNTLAPGDTMKASRLLRYLVDLDARYRQNPKAHIGNPHLDFVVPPALRFLKPLLRLIARSDMLSWLFDGAGSLYAPRGSIRLLRKASCYVDCFRRENPRAWGFTCPAKAPAGRIDYIFASPELAQRLSACSVVTEGNGTPGYEASDHLPVLAEFGEDVGAGFITPDVCDQEVQHTRAR